MGWKEWVMICGTVVTTIGTVVTIVSALRVKSYKDQIKFDIRKINLSGAINQIQRAQDKIRQFPTASANIPRGLKVKDLIQGIRSKFDSAIGVIAREGPDSDIREILTNAQEALNEYEVSFDGNSIEAQTVYKLQGFMQDAVSTINSRIFQLEGKA